MKYKYCPVCSGCLEEKFISEEEKQRLVCEKCGFIFYFNPSPAAAVILFDRNNRILLVKRKYEPKIGDWNLPAGFIEYDETVEQSAIREAKEETNLDVKLTGLFGVFSAFDDPRVHVIVIVYRGEIINGELKPGDDALEARFFPLDDLPANIAFDTHRTVLNMLIEENSANEKMD